MVKKPSPLPDSQTLLKHLPATRRELYDTFKIKGDARVAFKALLLDLIEQGQIARGPNRTFVAAHALKAVETIIVTHIDVDGDPVARPADWTHPEDPPLIYIDSRRAGEVTIGDRFKARIKPTDDGAWKATPLKADVKAPETMTGIYHVTDDGGMVAPADKRMKLSFQLPKDEARTLEDGDIIQFIPHQVGRNRTPMARLVSQSGNIGTKGSLTDLGIATAGLPVDFSPDALKETEEMKVPSVRGRTDLRAIPLVTIDGEDAKDFDDAVWAEPDDAPDNQGGWRVMVAIADVSSYVTSGSALDQEARARGNSVYFPDRVVPMLPAALSEDLCSLRPHEPRACMVMHMTLSPRGKLLKKRVERGLMRSAARLTYTIVQAVLDGQDHPQKPQILNLYGAFQSLMKARKQRGTLEMDIPERKVILNEQGRIAAIQMRERYDSHKLIEELMITANIAAAQILEEHKLPCMYRVHDKPDGERLASVAPMLKDLGVSVSLSGTVTPKKLSTVLAETRGHPMAPMIHEMILRSQSQAVYSPENKGHFGLALQQYAHFTSPIRRYADLVVHRLLVRAAGLGKYGATDDDMTGLDALGVQISQLERRAIAAERDVTDRYTAQFYEGRRGECFLGTVSGITHFGLFLRLDESGADGFVPARLLPNDFYRHDEKRHALVGRRSGRTFRMGDPVEVRLLESSVATGRMLFEPAEAGAPPPPGKPRPPRNDRTRKRSTKQKWKRKKRREKARP